MGKSYNANIYLIGLIFATLISFTVGKCSYKLRKKTGSIICSETDQDEYLSDVFAIRSSLNVLIEEQNITKISLNIANSNIPIIDEWLYLPWKELPIPVTTLRVTNSSVQLVKSMLEFRSLDILDLSSNNILDYEFLAKLKKLRYLHLRNSTFTNDSFILKFLHQLPSKLKLVDLRSSNLEEFYLFTNSVKEYDISESHNLKTIHYDYNSPLQYLNLSGNNQLESLNDINKRTLCVSELNLSNISNFKFSLLDDIVVLDRLILSYNSLKTLNESNFSLSNLTSKICDAAIPIPISPISPISIDLSNTNLEMISSKYFSNLNLGVVNLSDNNLSKLKGSIFGGSTIFILDISNSNISFIGPNVFRHLSVHILNLSKNNLTLLDGVFDHIESIQNLDLSFNPLQKLSPNILENCKSLEVLNLSSTFIKAFDDNTLSNLSKLRKVSLSFNESINLTAIRNAYLTQLTISSSSLNHLKPENFMGFYMLKELIFFNSSLLLSNISDSTFKGLNMLETLDIKGLNISDHEISIYKYLPSLLRLDLSNHNIKSIATEFENLHSLQYLNLSSNMISEISVNSFASLKKLEVLSLTDNQLSNMALGTFANLRKLTELYLKKNNLQKLYPGIFTGLDNLSLLDISENQLLRCKPHILFSVSLPKLKFLYLQNNKLGNEYNTNADNIRRYEFGLIANKASLKYIDINNNEWMCSTLIDVLSTFGNKNLTYRPTNPVYRESNINGVSCTTN